MDFIRALLYPFQGKYWYLRLIGLTLLIAIPYAGIVIGAGYVIAIIRKIAYDDDAPPGGLFYFRDGLEVVGNLILHGLAGLWITGVLFVLAGTPDETQPIHFMGLAVLGSLLMLHFLIGSIRYALTNDPHMMSQISQNVRLLFQNRWQVGLMLINAILYGSIMTGIAAFGLLGMFRFFIMDETISLLLIFVMIAVGTYLYIGMVVCGSGYLLGQLAHRLDLSGIEEKRKNEKIKPSTVG